jgi:FAD/FMN-containing dehydrogenase
VISDAEFRIRWTLTGVGSADLVWTAGGDVTEVHATYLSDGFAELVRAVLDLAIGARCTFTVLETEPGGYRLFLTRSVNEVFVQTVRFDDLQRGPSTWWSGGTLVWWGHVAVDGLFTEMLAAAGTILAEHGVSGYRKEWVFRTRRSWLPNSTLPSNPDVARRVRRLVDVGCGG